MEQKEVKEKLITLIENCIKNKDFLFNTKEVKNINVNCFYSAKTGFQYYKQDFVIESPDLHPSPPGVWAKCAKWTEKYNLLFVFEDEPSISIVPVSFKKSSEKNCSITVEKKFLGLKYDKTYILDIEKNDYVYTLFCGDYKFELENEMVEKLVSDYEKNIQNLKEVKFNEQLLYRIQKYAPQKSID